MNYKEVLFSFYPLEPWSEILIAYLSELEFESFEDVNSGVRAYIKENEFNLSEIDSIQILSVINETLDADELKKKY